ncbi:MAG: type II secretion system protein M [Woeseia sp.]|nr:type II secretion system protein M [Woeseia sp.]
MKDWFESLEARERVFVSVAAAFVVFAIYWFAIWQPLSRGEEDYSARINNWQSSLAELRSLRGQLQGGGSAVPNNSQGQSLVVIVDSTLRTRDLYSSLQRSQPTNTNGIRVEFDNIAFDDLVLWLGDLSNSHGLQVQTASFSQSTSNNPGRVNASLTLERA